MSNKPIKPSETLPSSFGGIKTNFSADKIANGYEPDVPDILGGANLNYLLDTLGKKEAYYDTLVDFINNIPIAKTISVDANDNLVYRDWLGGRNYGELVYSAIPLSDSGLKLLDGSLLSYSGVYKNFIDYIASIYNTYPSIFVTEEVWQNNVSTYGVCGKFVYNSTNNTVRLPKVTGLIEGTVDVNALGSIVAQGLPQHTHGGTTNSADKAHTHSRGSMNITGTVDVGYGTGGGSRSGAFYETSTKCNVQAMSVSNGSKRTGFDASKSWSGSTSSTSIAHSHTFTTGNANNTIYGASSKVQPQTVKCFIYIVVSTSLLRSDDVIDVDDIMSAIDSKADTDGSNMVNSLSSSALTYFTRLSLPTTTNITITIPTSGNTITAPADGYICCSNDITLTNETRRLYGTNMPVISGDTITVEYNSVDENSEIFFVYA